MSHTDSMKLPSVLDRNTASDYFNGRPKCVRDGSDEMTAGNLPMLSGIRVIDMTQFVAGPTASRILAELGADVIKVELAPYGDRTRVQGVRPKLAPENAAPYSTYFFQHNHSKRGIALDFKNPRGREILERRIEKADVLGR